MHITIYTRQNCGKCEDLIDEKIKETFSFTKQVIDTNLQSKQEFNQYGFKYVPAIVISNSKNEVLIKRDDISIDTFDSIIDEIGGKIQ